MRRMLCILVVLLGTASCGGPEESPPDHRVRVQVGLVGSYDGLPLTITAEPLPTPIDATILLIPGYEIRVTPEELDALTFDVLQVDEAKHEGKVLKTVRAVVPLSMADYREAIRKYGPPSIIAIGFTKTSAFDETVQGAFPHITHVSIMWPDGHGGDFILG